MTRKQNIIKKRIWKLEVGKTLGMNYLHFSWTSLELSNNYDETAGSLIYNDYSSVELSILRNRKEKKWKMEKAQETCDRIYKRKCHVIICCLPETHFRFIDTNRLKIKRWRKKTDGKNKNQNRTGTALLISEKITINTNVASQDKEGNYDDEKISASRRYNHYKHTELHETKMYKIEGKSRQSNSNIWRLQYLIFNSG